MRCTSVGRGASGGGTFGVGFPDPDQAGQFAFIGAESGKIELGVVDGAPVS